MTDLRYRQWYDENSASKFPFEDRATLTSDSGLSFSSSLFLDAMLYPHGHTGGLFISSILVSSASIRIGIGDDSQDEVCHGEFDPVATTGEIQVLDTGGRSAGILVSEPIRLAELQGWAIGTHVFTREAAPFVAACCVPTPEIGVAGIQLDSGEVVSGDFWLVGDDGVVLEVDQASRTDADGITRVYNVIRVHAVGDPLFRRRLCAPSLFSTPRFLKQLVVQSGNRTMAILPNARGDVPVTVSSRITADTVLRARAITSGLSIEVVGEQLKAIR